MKKKGNSIIAVFILVCIILLGCENNAQTSTDKESNLLTAKDFIDINLSAPEGSGAIRTLTIGYKENGETKSGTLGDINRIDHKDYNDEAKEQTFTDSDYDKNGIIEVIVYQEIWFPDLAMAHPEVPLWPTVYEYDLKKGFVVASAKHRDYFKTFAETSKEQLSAEKNHMSETSILVLKRLISAAEQIADGSFSPGSHYRDNYYADVYERTKNIVE